MSNTITGMMKVFYNNFLRTYTNTVTTSSGTGAENLYDGDRSTKWESSGSTDSVMETIQVDFSQTQTIDRILLLNMNWKYFRMFYWDEAWKEFTNVYTATGDSSSSAYQSASYQIGVYAWGASDTNNALTSRYFEFTAVSTTKIRIEIYSTITVNAQKYLGTLFIGREIGTFIDDVTSKPNSFDSVARETNSKLLRLSNGGVVRYEKSDKYSANFKLKQIWETADQSIIDAMFDYGEFALYPCGAVNQYTQRGWRIQDLYEVVIDGDQEASFNIGRDKRIGLDYSFKVSEQ